MALALKDAKIATPTSSSETKERTELRIFLLWTTGRPKACFSPKPRKISATTDSSMLSHAMAHSPGRLTKKTTLHRTATSASRDPTQTAQFSRFLLASGMTGGVYQTLGGAILPGRSRTGNPGVEPQLTITRAFIELSGSMALSVFPVVTDSL